MKSYARSVVVSLLSIVFLFALIFGATTWHARSLPAEYLIDRIEMCDGPIEACQQNGSYKTVALPDFQAPNTDEAVLQRSYRLQIPARIGDRAVNAVFFQRYDDAARIFMNGVLIRSDPGIATHRGQTWNRPTLLRLPGIVRSGNAVKIEIELSGYGFKGVTLLPILAGPHSELRRFYNVAHWATAAFAQGGVILMPIFAFAFGVLWLQQRRERTYGWMSLSLVFGTAVPAHFSFSELPLEFRDWTILWNAFVLIYLFALAQFVSRYLNARNRRREVIHLATVVASISLWLAVRDKFLLPTIGLTHIITISWALTVLSDLHHYRKSRTLDQYIIFGILSLALAVSVNDVFHIYFKFYLTPYFLGQILPISMLFLSISLIIMRLISVIGDHDKLSQSLQAQVEARSRELEASYARLAEAERKTAVDAERHRIMLDLHDGVGGHLTSMMAYMKNKDLSDHHLQDSVQTALRELSGAIDSLDGDNDAVAVLGMLRERYEPVLQRQGITLTWQVVGEPSLDHPGPESNLNLVRLCQEAFSNIVKHSEATRVDVLVDDRSLTIADDGKGIQRHKASETGRVGVGLSAMRERASRIGARFDITNTEPGTKIFLAWPTD